MMGLKQSWKLSAVLPHARLTELDHTGHMVRFSHTGELIQIIKSAAAAAAAARGTLPQK